MTVEPSTPAGPAALDAAVIDRRVRDRDRLAAVRATGLLDTPAEEPFDRLARLAAVTLGAPLAFVTVVDERRSFWKACIGVDAQDPADRQNALHESFCQYVVGAGAELVVGDAASDPRTRDNPAITGMGVAAWAGFPVRAPGGEVLGSFCVVDTVPRTWTTHDVDVLRTLAEAASGEVALRAAAERSAMLARTLQQALLPPVAPHVPGLQVGTYYCAAGSGDELIGDFYDVFETRDRRWNAVVGDVCGKGVEAARLTALARHTLRAGAMREARPSRVLALLDEALQRDDSTDGRFVTALLVALDPAPGDGGFAATLCSAGHVPALLRDDRGCRVIDAPGSLLGVLPELVLRDVALDLRPGDVLVLCTDGVTEARGPGREQFGLGRLSAALGGAGGDARAIAATLGGALRAFAGPRSDDDVAIVVLRVDPSA
ncbi:SpoIIE family protein phosphatase [Baekduia soli]|uniref:SpoIIE family protein phosphatase n=1 Tax=Baekduia soli TaxID=496014 RepID=A0A5B8U7W1_9ACTN|nr:GAF domain-containing SpoIIE family protein phosphatase [Baekduia soli]QEC49031.1 SpoIIE family protein phosphatase [Baekduia soli]